MRIDHHDFSAGLKHFLRNNLGDLVRANDQDSSRLGLSDIQKTRQRPRGQTLQDDGTDDDSEHQRNKTVRTRQVAFFEA